MEIIIQLLLLVSGFVLLVKGADWFVDGAAGAAKKFGIPSLVIGLTIVAMGTSAPEAAVSITAALKGSAAITIGNVVGSNILNILVILGLTALISPLAVAKSTVRVEIPFMIFVTILMLLLGYSGNSIVLWEGILLWGMFLLYLAYLFRMAKQNPQDAEGEIREIALWKLPVLILVGMAMILAGSQLAVDAATAIAQIFGMSDRFIGLTIVALGTSLPELVTSTSAALKKEADIAIGNIVGSNIFNLLFVIGTTALITPVVFEPGFAIDTCIAVAASFLLWLCVLREHRLSRAAGGIMLIGYVGYFLYLL